MNQAETPIQADPSNSSAQPQDPTILPSDPKAFPNLCPDYLAFKCKRRRECRLNHPKVCYNFLDHGKKPPYGCDGKTCHELHPPMCKDSLRDMKCFVPDCPLWHIRGTARKKRSEINTEQEQPNSVPAKVPPHQPTTVNQPHTSSKNNKKAAPVSSAPTREDSSASSVSFLEQVRLLKSELLEVLDTRFATLKSELSPKSGAGEYQ